MVLKAAASGCECKAKTAGTCAAVRGIKVNRSVRNKLFIKNPEIRLKAQATFFFDTKKAPKKGLDKNVNLRD